MIQFRQLICISAMTMFSFAEPAASADLGGSEFKLFERTGYDFDAYIGYKALSVDYSEGSGNRQYRYDAVQHGPVLGGTLRF